MKTPDFIILIVCTKRQRQIFINMNKNGRREHDRTLNKALCLCGTVSK